MFELQEPYFNCPKSILIIYILQNMFNVYIILKSRKIEERKMLVFRRKSWRRLLDQLKIGETGEWRAKNNDELERLFRKENIY